MQRLCNLSADAMNGYEVLALSAKTKYLKNLKWMRGFSTFC